MKTRSELREISMKSLYQVFVIQNTSLDLNVEAIIKENIEEENEFVETIVNGVLEHKEDIKSLINKYLEGWTVDRFNFVDQAIMYIGVYELIYTRTPSIVSINESVELSKKYSDEQVTKMINAVLDNIYHSEESNAR